MPVVTRLASLLGKPVRDKRGAIKLDDDAIVKLIVKADKKPDPPRNNPKGYIHVSSLIRGECPRALALRKLNGVFYDELATGATRIMWELGRAAEKHVRAQLIASLPPLQVYGQWQCPCHNPKAERYGRTREGFAEDTGRCVRCGHPAMIYVELDLECDSYFVTGHPDFILILDGCIYPVEIKSITNSANANKNKEGFNTIEKAMVNHVLQVSCYHRMLTPLSKKLGIPLGQKAIVLYVGKDFDGFRTPYPYKQFNINPFEHKLTIQEIFNDARMTYLATRGGGAMPPRLDLCPTPGSKCAAGCDMVHQCFAKAKKAASPHVNPIILRD